MKDLLKIAAKTLLYWTVMAIFAAMFVFAMSGCAGEPTRELAPEYHTLTSSASTMGVLASSVPEIQGDKVVWTCRYDTQDGSRILTQQAQCAPLKWVAVQP